MKQFQELVQRIYDEGEFKGDRTGTGTYSVFGHQMRFDLRKGFPLVTTKYTPISAIIRELLWFRDGETNINHPIFAGTKIWNEWALAQDYVVEEEYTIDELLKLYAEKQKIDLRMAVLEYRGMCAVMTKSGVSADDLSDPLAHIDQELFARTKRTEVTKESVMAGIKRANDTIRHRMGMAIDAKKRTLVKAAGDIGPMYGFIWRNFGGVDQLKEVINNLRARPNSRRHLVSAWDPTKLPDESKSHKENVESGKGVLAPCHAFFQFNAIEITEVARAEYYNEHVNPAQPVDLSSYIDRDGEEKFPGSITSLSVVLDNKKAPTHWIDLQLYQRSCDVGLGLPFNIASYAALLIMIGNELNYAPRHYVHTTGDTHIYNNHLTALQPVLERAPHKLPKLKLKVPVGTSIFDLKESDFELVDYKYHDKIHLPISV